MFPWDESSQLPPRSAETTASSAKIRNHSTGWVRGEVGWYRGLQDNGWRHAAVQDAEIKGYLTEVPVILSAPPSRATKRLGLKPLGNGWYLVAEYLMCDNRFIADRDSLWVEHHSGADAGEGLFCHSLVCAGSNWPRWEGVLLASLQHSHGGAGML